MIRACIPCIEDWPRAARAFIPRVKLVLAIVLSVAATAGCTGQQPRSISATKPALTTDRRRAMELLEQAMDDAANLRLARNRIQLARDAAEALSAENPDQAAQILLHALSEVDRAESEVPAKDPKRQEQLAELEFIRRPILLQLVHLNPELAMNALDAPQSADNDAEFQRLIFEAVAEQNPALVQAAALNKLGRGLSPAVVSAYAVLRHQDPAMARNLAAAMAQKLAQQSPGDSPDLLTATLQFLRQMRVDEGMRAPVVLIDQQALDPRMLNIVVNSLADQLLAEPNPREAVIPQSLESYIAAIEPFSEDKAQKLRQASASLATSIEPTRTADQMPAPPPVSDGSETMTAAAQQARENVNSQLGSLLRESQSLLPSLEAQLKTAPNNAARRALVLKAIESTNSLMEFAVANAALLNPESFRGGEYEFYSFSPLITPINATNRLIVAFASFDPSSAIEITGEFAQPELEVDARIALAVAMMKPPPAVAMNPAATAN
jgi:hypothetical protein